MSKEYRTFEEWWENNGAQVRDSKTQSLIYRAWHARDTELSAIARLEAGDEQRVRDISRLTIERDEAREELAARDERDRRIRLDEHKRLCLTCQAYQEKYWCERGLSLRAPVPAERAGDAVCPTCRGAGLIFIDEHGSTNFSGWKCPDCHGTGRASKKD